jgi:hypothetical protein
MGEGEHPNRILYGLMCETGPIGSLFTDILERQQLRKVASQLRQSRVSFHWRGGLGKTATAAAVLGLRGRANCIMM